jgi:hypothetical protein
MNTGAANLDALLLQHTNKKEREILDAYAGRGSGVGPRQWPAKQGPHLAPPPLPPVAAAAASPPLLTACCTSTQSLPFS